MEAETKFLGKENFDLSVMSRKFMPQCLYTRVNTKVDSGVVRGVKTRVSTMEKFGGKRMTVTGEGIGLVLVEPLSNSYGLYQDFNIGNSTLSPIILIVVDKDNCVNILGGSIMVGWVGLDKPNIIEDIGVGSNISIVRPKWKR